MDAGSGAEAKSAPEGTDSNVADGKHEVKAKKPEKKDKPKKIKNDEIRRPDYLNPQRPEHPGKVTAEENLSSDMDDFDVDNEEGHDNEQ